jgi:hypothetical protein
MRRRIHGSHMRSRIEASGNVPHSEWINWTQRAKQPNVTRDGARTPAARKITFKFRTKWRVFTLSIPLHPSRLTGTDLMSPLHSKSEMPESPKLPMSNIPARFHSDDAPGPTGALCHAPFSATCARPPTPPPHTHRVPQGAHALATVHALPPCWYADMSMAHSCCSNGTGVVDFDVSGLVLSANTEKGECQRRRRRLAGGMGRTSLGFRF